MPGYPISFSPSSTAIPSHPFNARLSHSILPFLHCHFFSIAMPTGDD
jgi:hypothetical protein